MASVADKFCANCVMHSWKQPEDRSSLRSCGRCQMIQYCSRACRKEHWEKVHKNHCQFLADPSKCPQSQHDAETCALCRPAPGTGKGKQRLAGRDKKLNSVSFNYECITKDKHFTPNLTSPHPFPVAGARGDLLEKNIIVVQNLVHKLKQNPRVTMTCLAELEAMEQILWSKRMEMWGNKKVFSHPQFVHKPFALWNIRDLTRSVRTKLSQGNVGNDAWELWKINEVVLVIMSEITEYHVQDALKDPVDTMPQEFTDLVKLKLDNKFEFLDVAEEIIDSLSTQIVPYKNIIKIFCGSKKRQNCSFCGVKIGVTDLFEIMIKSEKNYPSASVLFDSVSLRKYICGSQDCYNEACSRTIDNMKLNLAVTTALQERTEMRCDFCFQLCPTDKAHRCCNCLTVVYCSKSCHKKDKPNHSKNYCFEDERKTKKDRSMRIEMGEMVLEKLFALNDSIDKDLASTAIVKETLEAFQHEDSKIKKQPRDNPDTEREHDTSIPAAATVPASEDNGSKSSTGHRNDRSLSEARNRAAVEANISISELD